MEALSRMFGAKKGEPPTPQMAIQKLRETEDMLNKKSEFLEKKIDQENALIKKHGLKNKRGERYATTTYIYMHQARPLNYTSLCSVSCMGE